MGHNLRRASILVAASYLLVNSSSARTGAKLRPADRPERPRPSILVVEAPFASEISSKDRYPSGSRILLLAPKASSPRVINLTPEFFAAADPEISFDGQKLLFSGQKAAGEAWQIWEMDASGTKKRQVTACIDGCMHAAYLPDDEIVFTTFDREGPQLFSNLAVAKLDGSQLRRITFGRANFELQTVLRDGRILASASWPLGVNAEPPSANRGLYTLRPDGTALESLRCDHQSPATRFDAREVDDGSVVFVRNTKNMPDELVMIRRGAVREISFAPRGTRYRSPSQLSANELLVARQYASAGNASPKFALSVLNLKNQARGAPLFSEPNFSVVQAVPVAPHSIPKKFWSILNPESKAAYFISLNSYLSQDAPAGRFADTIARVRVLTSSPSEKDSVLGEAPVETDGSFYIEVPANQPVRFELLDPGGRIIQAQHGWVWARPGEQRGCTGCHNDKALAPENQWPLALKRFDTPFRLGAQEHAAASGVTSK